MARCCASAGGRAATAATRSCANSRPSTAPASATSRPAAEAIERLRPEIAAREPETLARHRAAAGEVREAIELYRLAGERSAARSALREARAHLVAALDLLAGLPRDAWRDARELDLQIPLAVAVTWVEGQAATVAGQVYARARELCGLVGDTERLVPVLAGLAVHHINRAEPQIASGAAEEMLRLAHGRGDAAAELAARRILGYAAFKRGRLAEARGHLEQVLGAFDPARHRTMEGALGGGFPMDTRIGGLAWLANTLFVMGFPDQALAHGRAALAEARALQHVQSHTTALVAAGCVFHCLARDAAATRLHAEELEALSIRASAFRNVARIYRGWVLSEADPEEGIARIEEALADYRATGAGTVVVQALALLAESQRRAGRPERGLDLLEEALAAVERAGSASSRRSCTASAASCCRRCRAARPSPACGARSRWRGRRARGCGSCAPPPPWRGYGVIAAGEARRATCWRRSSAGSPRASAGRTCLRRGRCWRN